ncbi:integrase, catalytic region, zinc finger, CCHC-type containing protein [Tanacetum coccineum]|uniref:Integrase, catalytic region, zinc finger, CCHC-type containing protein n=1 Tax=Tanacetum coccineum TaxID=301880 RepID=A0ABQ5EZ32_9ASTR
MFMANLSSADLVFDEAGPSYDSATLSEVQEHDNCLDNMNESHEEHEIHNDVQPNDVIDSDTEYTSNSNIVSYEQYKELAEMRMIIKDHNVMEESLQKELHSVKMQLNSTLNHKELIREEVSTLKQDFKQKENKLLEEFLDMKHLKEKVEDKLYKQDQSLQTVHMLCKPNSFYDEVNRVAIGYKNPFYLSKAKQVQPALYNGHEIVKTNHARALVYDSKDTLEIAETTRKQMIKKMKDPECVKKKVKIAPHDYSKENYLATFTPQKKLTPEQIFWSGDLLKMKAKSLKEKAKSAKPITAMMVYPPNTPAKLVPKVLSTKSQVQVNIYSLVQLFSEFDKICKKRITPMGLTEGKRGFEQTKSCYLTEVILFFKTIKEQFEGIQKALVNKIKEMKEVFDQMEVEVDQHAVDNEADLILDFKALDSQNKDLNANVNALQDLNERFRVENEKVKQHYKELYDSIKLTHAKTIEKTMYLLIEIKTLKAQLKGKTKCVTMHDPVKPKVLTPSMYAIDIVEEARVEKPLDSSLASACLYTKHSQKSLKYVIGTCPKDFNKRDRKIATALLNRKKQVTFVEPVKYATPASGLKPRSNTKKDRTLPAKSDKKNVEDHSRNNKSSMKQKNHVDSSISYKHLEVAFHKHSCYVRDVNGVDLIKGNRGTNLYTISVEDMIKSSPICLLSKASKNKSWLWHRRVGIFHQTSVLRTSQQNDIVKRQNRTRVEAARTMLIFSKALMFLWEKAIATACYTQN